MAKPAKADREQLHALSAELDIIRIGGPSSVRSVIGELRRLSELESMLCICPVERASGWGVERFDSDNLPNETKFRQLSTAFLETAPRRFGWFDAIRPEPAQRNVVLSLDDLVSRDELERSPVYKSVLLPLRLHQTHQIRALICDGPSLLGWFGALHTQPPTAGQRDLMSALIPALRRRLSLDRRIDASSTTVVALETVLEQLGAPAFVIGVSGRIVETNESGRVLLETRRQEVSAGLQATIAQRPSTMQFELTRLREHGAGDHWLAILRTSANDPRVARAIALASSRYKLTPRQREVLHLVLRGEANTTIAALLAISERAVEHHVSGMFDRTAVNSRAALVASVLLGSNASPTRVAAPGRPKKRLAHRE